MELEVGFTRSERRAIVEIYEQQKISTDQKDFWQCRREGCLIRAEKKRPGIFTRKGAVLRGNSLAVNVFRLTASGMALGKHISEVCHDIY
jgi:hypothetical protein